MDKSILTNEFSERVTQYTNLNQLKSIVVENEKETYNARFSSVNWLVKFFVMPILLAISVLTEFAFIYTSIYSTTGSKLFSWIVSVLVIGIIEGLKLGLGYNVSKFFVNWWFGHKHYIYAFLMMFILLGCALAASVICSIKGIPIAVQTAAEWTYNPPNEGLILIDKQIADARQTKWKGTTTNESTKTITTLSKQRAMIVQETVDDKDAFKDKVKSIGLAFKMFGGIAEFMMILALLMMATFVRFSYIELSDNDKQKVRDLLNKNEVKKKTNSDQQT